jgi:regulator of sirC expression with transglutaminase-like and TPR domain
VDRHLDHHGAIARFGELVATGAPPLAGAAVLVAVALGESRGIGAALARVQHLADGVEGEDLTAVTRHLFETVGLRGDTATYHDPANSLLPSVLDRGRGIPVTLAILAVDVARRRGLDAAVVAMPGHVLIGDADPPTRWCDGFDGGQWLDGAGAEARFEALQGGRVPFDPRYLRATPDPLVLARLLANLVVIYAASGHGVGLAHVRLLRAQIPGVAERERPELAAALAGVGRFAEAAAVWDAEQAQRRGEPAEAAAANARHLRSRFN